MASISAPGSGSGIDVGNLVSQLLAAESEPTLVRLGQREADFQSQFTGLGQLKSALSQFGGSLISLTSTATFEGTKSTTSDDSVFTVTSSSTAPVGNFSIEVEQLASSQKLVSPGFGASTDPVGSGTLLITGGGTAFTVAIPSTANTLGEIRDAINSAEGNPGISASLLTVDAAGGGTETRLSLTASGTGTVNNVTVTVTDDDGNNTDVAGLSALVFDPLGSGIQNLTESNAATDAIVHIDGQQLTTNSNTIDFAIQGVTLTLVSEAPEVVQQLSVAVDRSGAEAAVKSFVDGYNSLRATINELTAFDPATGASGVLLGDGGVRGVSSLLQRELGSFRDVSPDAFGALSEIGITTQADGSLSINSSTLTAALEQNFDSVGELFAADEGVATRLRSLVEEFTSSQGVLDQRTDSITARLDAITVERETLGRRLAARETSLLAQFSAMDALVGRLQSSSSFLAQQLGAISGISSS